MRLHCTPPLRLKDILRPDQECLTTSIINFSPNYRSQKYLGAQNVAAPSFFIPLKIDVIEKAKLV